jgi:hypothetical protein
MSGKNGHWKDREGVPRTGTNLPSYHSIGKETGVPAIEADGYPKMKSPLTNVAEWEEMMKKELDRLLSVSFKYEWM